MDPLINEILYSAVTNIHRQSQDLNEVERSFGKVLSEPRNPHLKDQVARVDQIVQDQLEYLHDLYNNPAVEGYSVYPKAHYQQEMRSAYYIAMDKLKRIRQDMLAHETGKSQKSKLFMEAPQPAAANPIRHFGNSYNTPASVNSIGQVSSVSKAPLSSKPAAAESPIAKVAAQEKKAIDDEDEEMLCPITGEVMKDPYMDPEGNSYEKIAILQWLTRNNSSPITRTPLTAEQLAPNRALKNLIQKKYSK